MIEASLMCCVAGCPNRWTCEFGFGALCSEHDRVRRDSQRPLPPRPQYTVPVPKTAPAPHWQDDDDGEVDF